MDGMTGKVRDMRASEGEMARMHTKMRVTVKKGDITWGH